LSRRDPARVLLPAGKLEHVGGRMFPEEKPQGTNISCFFKTWLFLVLCSLALFFFLPFLFFLFPSLPSSFPPFLYSSLPSFLPLIPISLFILGLIFKQIQQFLKKKYSKFLTFLIHVCCIYLFLVNLMFILLSYPQQTTFVYVCLF
jgi:hypothetical protein